MSESACWCDDKSDEPRDGICRLRRDHERLEAEIERLRNRFAEQRRAGEFWERRYNEQHQTLHSAEDGIEELAADVAALEEAAEEHEATFAAFAHEQDRAAGFYRDLATLREAAQAVLQFRDHFIAQVQTDDLPSVLIREQEAWDALRAVLASAEGGTP